MAGHADNATFNTALAEIKEQRRVREVIKQSFGWKPVSVRFLDESRQTWSVCVVEVRFGVHRAVEVMFSNGLMVGIPPKKARFS
jgi:hypothetical protein